MADKKIRAVNTRIGGILGSERTKQILLDSMGHWMCHTFTRGSSACLQRNGRNFSRQRAHPPSAFPPHRAVFSREAQNPRRRSKRKTPSHIIRRLMHGASPRHLPLVVNGVASSRHSNIVKRRSSCGMSTRLDCDNPMRSKSKNCSTEPHFLTVSQRSLRLYPLEMKALQRAKRVWKKGF